MNARKANAGIAVFLWGIIVLIFVGTFVGTFIVPRMVPAWKAQGLKELPVGWQILVDASDFSIHRGWMVLPILILLAVFFTTRTLRANTAS